MAAATSFSRYDLLNAEDRIAELRGYIERERSKLYGLQAESAEATSIQRMLSALGRTLDHFQGHRSRIERDLGSRDT